MGVNFGTPKTVPATSTSDKPPVPVKPAPKPAAKPSKPPEPLIDTKTSLAKAKESAAFVKEISKSKPDTIINGVLIPDPERIPTGVFDWDLATGGGIPTGRLSIIYGPESSCKTNVCFGAIANVQRRQDYCNTGVLVNLEGTFNPAWAGKHGVDNEKLLVVNAGYGEEAVDLIEGLFCADDVGIIVVDSIAVLTSAKEAEKTTEIADVGSAAMLVKRLCNKLALRFAQEAKRGHFPAIVFINQTRFKPTQKGDPETMPGGQTMKFMSSLTVRQYGKDVLDKDVHPTKPVFKELICNVKKAKVPVNTKAFEFNMALYPQKGIPIGQSKSWNAVKSRLSDAGEYGKLGNKFIMMGEEFDKAGDIEERYYTDQKYKASLQKRVIELASEDPPMLVEDTV